MRNPPSLNMSCEGALSTVNGCGSLCFIFFFKYCSVFWCSSYEGWLNHMIKLVAVARRHYYHKKTWSGWGRALWRCFENFKCFTIFCAGLAEQVGPFSRDGNMRTSRMLQLLYSPPWRGWMGVPWILCSCMFGW